MLSLQLKISNLNLLFISIFVALSSDLANATDFETVLQAAQKNSTEFAKVKANADEVAALHRASYSKFLPRAGVESRYETFDSAFAKVSGGTSNVFIEWNIFKGFKDFQNRKSLDADSNAARLEKERMEMNLKWIAMAKYTKAQVMQESVDVYKGVIQSNLKNLEAVKIRRSSGRLSDADYLEFELFDSKLKQDLIDLETKALAAMAELEAFSGITPLKQLSSELKPKKLNLDNLNLLEILSSNKSKVYESQLKVESAEARKSFTTGGYLPEVNLKTTYGSMGLRETTVSPEVAFGVTAKWEIFSGLETYNDRRVAVAQLAKANAEFENSKIQNLSRADQLRNLLKSIISRYDFEEKNLKNIERFLKTVQDEYRRGVKNSNDLKSALELALETQLNRASLRSDYFAAKAELQDILGIELNEQ